MNPIIKTENCSKKCRHRAVWADLPNGKTTQVRECRTKRYVDDSAAAVKCFVEFKVPADVTALVRKACK